MLDYSDTVLLHCLVDSTGSSVVDSVAGVADIPPAALETVGEVGTALLQGDQRRTLAGLPLP